MKTLHELNSKMLYRLLKVFFIIISIASLLITWNLNWDGEKYEFISEKRELYNLDSGNMFLDLYPEMQPTNFQLIKLTLPYLLINVLVLIIIQRAFYYVVTGTVRPK